MSVHADRPRIAWPQAAAEFVIALSPDELPATPWEFAPGRTSIDNAQWLAQLQRDALRGPTSPTAYYGVLQRDPVRLAQLCAVELFDQRESTS